MHEKCSYGKRIVRNKLELYHGKTHKIEAKLNEEFGSDGKKRIVEIGLAMAQFHPPVILIDHTNNELKNPELRAWINLTN